MLTHADTPDEMLEDEQRRKPDQSVTYILHPITHEVHRVPNEALLHDSENPVCMGYNIFEQMGLTGQLSGERLTHHGSRVCAFNASQVLAVRLKRDGANAGGPPLYAWATRMVTALPKEIFPNECHAMVGYEFLWLWPPGKAYNAWHTRRNKLCNGPLTLQPSPIDEIEPTCRYTPSVPGAMFGPDDIEGTVHVPFEDLTPLQRFFVMCIKPQQTLFPRRPKTDHWTQRVAEIIDKNQLAARQGVKWELHNSVQRLLQRKNDPIGCGATSKKRKLPLVAGAGKRTVPFDTKSFCYGGSSTDEESESSELSDVDEILNGKEQWHRAVREEERARLWGKLPNELLVRILCTRLGDGLINSHVDAARTSLLTLRGVSKNVLALTASYVGVQLANLHRDAVACLLPPGYPEQNSALDPRNAHVEVAARVRALGLCMTDALQLDLHKVQLHRVPGWTLPKTPSTVPDWRWFLELRREARQRHGTKINVQRWLNQSAPSAEYAKLMKRHRHGEPHVWGSRFPDSGFGFNVQYDAMVVAAGECDVREHMHDLAGV